MDSADAQPTVAGLIIARDGSGYQFESPGLARWHVGPKGELLTEAALCGVDQRSVRAEFESQVAPMLGQLRGNVVLHASCVALARGAVAFVGPSGSGKSTLAALYVQAGRPVLADDGVELLAPSNSSSQAHPLALPAVSRFARLREGTVRRLEPVDGRSEADGRVAVSLSCAEPTPLVAIFLLERSAAISVEPLSKRDSVLALARNCLRVDPFDAALLRLELSQLEAIVGSVAVLRLSYPRCFDQSDALLERIAEQLTCIAAET
jgi:energy-coupling factor transporter ATP-binding protein EcfA2